MNKLFWLLLLVIACAPVQEPAQESAREPVSSVPAEPVSAPVAPKVPPKVQVAQVPEPVERISDEDGKCLQLGCPLGTALIGDRKTDLYYACYCTFVKWLKPDDMLCFSSAIEAKERGYRQAQSC